MNVLDRTAHPQPAPAVEPAQWAELMDERPFELPAGNVEEAIALLKSWREDKSDEQDQRETWECLQRVLDEDRFSDRKLFS